MTFNIELDLIIKQAIKNNFEYVVNNSPMSIKIIAKKPNTMQKNILIITTNNITLNGIVQPIDKDVSILDFIDSLVEFP